MIETESDDRHGFELTRRTTNNAAWSISTRLATKLLDFVTLLILARLLVPADFGIIAIAMTSVSIVEAVLELPIYQVLIGLDTIERRHLDTAFTLGAFRGLAMALILTTVAVPFAYFYGDPRLVPLIATLSLAPAMRGLASPRMVIFAKKLDYSRELVGEILSKTVSFVLASVAALFFRDYRALMVATLATPTTWIIVSYLLAPYRPRFSMQAWPVFAHFMGWTTSSQLLSALNWQSDRLILGGFVSRAELGTFSLANDLSFIPEQALIRPIVRPLVSAFALIRTERERLKLAYLKAANTMLAIGTPVLLGLSLLAAPAVRLALGGKWIAAIAILQWLALTLIPPLFTSPFSSLAMALGRPEAVLRQNAMEALVKLPLMLLGAALLGIDGAIAARAISAILAAMIVLYLTKQLIGTPVILQIAGTWRVGVAAFVLAGVLLLLRPFLEGVNGLMLGLLLALVSLLGLAGYVVTLGVVWMLSGRPPGLERTVSDRLIAPLIARIAKAPR